MSRKNSVCFPGGQSSAGMVSHTDRLQAVVRADFSSKFQFQFSFVLNRSLWLAQVVIDVGKRAGTDRGF